MKRSLHTTASWFLLVLLICSLRLSAARFLATQQGHGSLNLENTNNGGEATVDTELTGVEVCENGDEDCFNRRMISEAHLDYVYTEHHKP